MQKPSPGVCPEGAPLIGWFALLCLTLALLRLPVPALAALALTGFLLYFFRDPPRVVASEPGAAVAPADGKIVFVGRAEDPGTGQERLKISIFMNVFNVHVNRSPVRGSLQRLDYIPGKFFNASLDKASAGNERNMLQIADDQGQTWTVVQIAGLLARRIVCRAEEGDALERGQRFGLIMFGSRLDLYLPHGYDPVTSYGDRVFAGQSVLARQDSEWSECPPAGGRRAPSRPPDPAPPGRSAPDPVAFAQAAPLRLQGKKALEERSRAWRESPRAAWICP